MIRVSTERAGKAKARELARKYDAHYGVWLSEQTPGEYLVGPVHAGWGLPGGPQQWDLRFIAKPRGYLEVVAREAVVVLIVAALFGLAIWWPA